MTDFSTKPPHVSASYMWLYFATLLKDHNGLKLTYLELKTGETYLKRALKQGHGVRMCIEMTVPKK